MLNRPKPISWIHKLLQFRGSMQCFLKGQFNSRWILAVLDKNCCYCSHIKDKTCDYFNRNVFANGTELVFYPYLQAFKKGW